jgi:putative tryptophan/tyrosine transport system substrate-binding protein
MHLGDRMRRREFIALAACAGAAWPLAAHAQQSPMPVIGFLHSGSFTRYAHLVTAFQQGLRQAGYVEGQNVAIEYRWADGNFDRLPAIASDLVRRQEVRVLAALGGDPVAKAAKAATATVPIIFVGGLDPVKLGLVSSLNRPGANITGVVLLSSPLLAKQLQLLCELVPAAETIALLVNPNNPNTDNRLEEIREAARAVGRELLVATAKGENEFELAFATIRQRAGALVVPPDPTFTARREELIALAARHAVPASYPFREYAVSGGLMSYGASLSEAYRLAGTYCGRVLKGEKPTDLPVQQTTKVEFVINLKTAKTLAISLPLPLLGRADEVIE